MSDPSFTDEQKFFDRQRRNLVVTAFLIGVYKWAELKFTGSFFGFRFEDSSFNHDKFDFILGILLAYFTWRFLTALNEKNGWKEFRDNVDERAEKYSWKIAERRLGDVKVAEYSSGHGRDRDFFWSGHYFCYSDELDDALGMAPHEEICVRGREFYICVLRALPYVFVVRNSFSEYLFPFAMSVTAMSFLSGHIWINWLRSFDDLFGEVVSSFCKCFLGG